MITPTITQERAIALSDEAANAGDIEQVNICQAALDDDVEAIAECARVVADADELR